MKRWPVLVLVLFIAIAGYKFFVYQHQLLESKAEKERLSSVLARSRATETRDLKVIKAAPKLLSKYAGTIPFPVASEQSALPLLRYFQVNHPPSPPSLPNSVICDLDSCEVKGLFGDNDSELEKRLISVNDNTQKNDRQEMDTTTRVESAD